MNFGEIVALIADDLIDERLTNVQIQNAVNQALRFYSRKTFYFNTIKASLQTVPNQEYYTAFNPDLEVADLYTIQTIRYENGEVSIALRPMSDASMENVSPLTSSYVLPSYYTYAQMQIRLFPTPKEIGTLTIIATYMYPKLEADDDTNVFLERADELIRQAAKRYIAFNVLHDTGLGDRVSTMEAEEFASLQAETRAREPVVPMKVSSDLFALTYSSLGSYDVVTDT